MGRDAEAAEPQWVEPWPRHEGSRRARDLLVSAFERDTDVEASAPGRITIIGEYTDIGGGLSLPTVLPHRTYVAIHRRDDDVVRIAHAPHESSPDGPGVWTGSLATLSEPRDGGWSSYLAGPLWALQERGYSGPGLDIAVTSCVPFGAGVSSLVSATAAVAMGINAAWGLGLPTGADASDLADVCIDVENDFVGAATAGLSQHTIVRCREGEALMLDFSESPPRAQPCPLYFPEYGLTLLIVHAGPRAGTQLELVRSRVEDMHKTCDALGLGSLRELLSRPDARHLIDALEDPLLQRRARHFLTENERVEIMRDEFSGTGPAHERFVEAGKAMYRSHASLDANMDVSSAALNLAVETAFRSGALGAHMVGAGIDSSAVALVRSAAAPSTAQMIDREFIAAGLPRPAFLML